MATYRFEVYYLKPANPEKEASLLERVSEFGGWLDFREESGTSHAAICLTYEFSDFEHAKLAASELQNQGEYIEGPGLYRLK